MWVSITPTEFPRTKHVFSWQTFWQSLTGLPFVIWIGVDSGLGQDIAVWGSGPAKARWYEMVRVAIGPTLRVGEGALTGSKVGLLARWVDLNQDVLVRYWNGQIDTKDA